MSTFACPIVRVRAIEPIPDADAIELAVVGEFRSVVRKGAFQPGDRAVYLPEAAVLPEGLIAELGLTGKLAGKAKNRIKAVRLRGCLSQGILLDGVDFLHPDGHDMAAALGVTKYEPPIPAVMAGEVANLFGHPLKYEIENFKAWPDVLTYGEPVVITEKLHGTFCGVGVIPGLDYPEMFADATSGKRHGLVYSKGLGGKGLCFKDNAANDRNIYVQAARKLGLHRRIHEWLPGRTVHVLGEVYGPGVQDLHYGRQDRGFAVFDINVDGRYLNRAELWSACVHLRLDMVPLLYSGAFSREKLAAFTDGTATVGGAHTREGVVVVPVIERRDDKLGRVILKSVSADYLLRKGNATEYA